MATSLGEYVDLSLAGKLLLTLSTIYILKSIFVAIYNVTLHPLAKVPGPKLYAASYLPSHWWLWTGDIASPIKAMHDQYGDTVRIEPNFVSFNNAEAWRGIYGQSAGKSLCPRIRAIRSKAKTNILAANGVIEWFLGKTGNDDNNTSLRYYQSVDAWFLRIVLDLLSHLI